MRFSGCALHQSGDRVAARDFGGQRVIGIGGVERGGFLVVAHRLFKLQSSKSLLAWRKLDGAALVVGEPWALRRFAGGLRGGAEAGAAAGAWAEAV